MDQFQVIQQPIMFLTTMSSKFSRHFVRPLFFRYKICQNLFQNISNLVIIKSEIYFDCNDIFNKTMQNVQGNHLIVVNKIGTSELIMKICQF